MLRKRTIVNFLTATNEYIIAFNGIKFYISQNICFKDVIHKTLENNGHDIYLLNILHKIESFTQTNLKYINILKLSFWKNKYT